MKVANCLICDDFQDIFEKARVADGLILASPVYFGSMTGQCKSFIDRCVMFRRNDWRFRNRVGAVLAVGACRNGGQELTLDAVRAAMLCHDMICVGDGQPKAHFGATLVSGAEGSVDKDDFGLELARNTGRRVAEVALRLRQAGG